MKSKERRDSLIVRFSSAVERVGNKLPNPLYIYLAMIIAVLIISAICAVMGVSVTYDAVDRSTGNLIPTTIQAVNLLSKESLRTIFANLVNAFDDNMVLPVILVMTMFVAIADRSGFFTALLRKSLMNTPPVLTTFILSVVSVCASLMGDAGIVLAPAIGAVVYKSINRNPWIGVMVGYGAVSAGFTACLVPTVTDVLYVTITNVVSAPLGATISVFSLWYYMIVATLVISVAITFVTEKYLTRLLGDRKRSLTKDKSALAEYALAPAENRGLRFAGIAFLLVALLLMALILPKNGFLRNEDGTLLPTSPFVDCMLPIFCLIFAVVGISYGIGSGSLKRSEDIPKWMAESCGELGGLIVNFFAIAVFLYVFSLSNLSGIVAVAGERFLRAIGLTGLPMLCIFSIFMGLMELIVYGGAARWTMFAPIFVPMFMGVGMHPAYITLAYRLGDSFIANITPLNSCLVLTLALLVKYRDPELNPEEPGLGTIFSAQIPLCIATLIVMLGLMSIFYLFNIPLGPAS